MTLSICSLAEAYPSQANFAAASLLETVVVVAAAVAAVVAE